MKKLTGYIGAMIIVFALMGSVLLGYALNINGTTEVINEYDEVTDVSGLYSYSDEKSYIAYNPASNYINYDKTETLNNPTGGYTLKDYIGKIATIEISGTGDVTVNGVAQGKPSSYLTACFVCDYFYIELYSNTVNFVGYDSNGSYVLSSNGFKITVSGTDVTLKNLTNNSTYFYQNLKHCLSYYSGSDFDYYKANGYASGDTNVKNAYLKNKNDLVSVIKSPNVGISVGNSIKFYNHSTDTLTNYDNIFSTYENVFYGNINYNLNYQPYAIFYPKSTVAIGLGIDYTDSNRVNNYPIEYDYNTNISTTTENLNLQALSVYDYYSGGEWFIRNGTYSQTVNGVTTSGTTSVYVPRYATNALTSPLNDIHKYKLSDVLSLATIPSGTTMIKIESANTSSHSYSHALYINNNVVSLSSGTIPDSIMCFTNGSTNDNTLSINNNRNTLYYYPDTGLVDVYDVNNVKIATQPVTDTYVQFVDDTGLFGKIDYTNDQNNPSNGTTYYQKTTRIQPSINLIYSVSGVITTVHYADITKGYQIKSDNVNDTIWNNEYENGKIQILFRADSTTTAYSNEITVSGNDISIDYAASRFSITLNGGDPVNVGMWRSIVLDIDLINGRLSAIPVRTFNNFTSVQMDSANIFIGNLTGSTPTNTIAWKPTTNSLSFNIYETDVFMDTYGVVMVDPTLNITNYFTNLDQFYRLKIYNFSIYGSDITVNGVTGTVTGNNITFNGETVQLKEMYVTYADGHVYVEDSHVSIDLGTIATNDISMTGAWYFNTFLEKGYTSQKLVYDWDWSSFILDNTQFCIFYIGIALAGLIIARRFCSLSIIDYVIFITSIILALSIQVIA